MQDQSQTATLEVHTLRKTGGVTSGRMKMRCWTSGFVLPFRSRAATHSVTDLHMHQARSTGSTCIALVSAHRQHSLVRCGLCVAQHPCTATACIGQLTLRPAAMPLFS